jgi:signal transduction histidine kinase
VVNDSSARSAADAPLSPLSWPLVERRKADRPTGHEDRRRPANVTDPPPALVSTALWPFRLAALAGAAVRAAATPDIENWRLWGGTAVVALYTLATIIRPIPYRNDTNTRLRIIAEHFLITGVALLSGAWSSPFVLCLIPVTMLAAFASGGMFSTSLVSTSVAALSIMHIDVDRSDTIRESLLWAGMLLLVAFTSGLAHRAALDSQHQQQLAFDRVNRLAEANSLLFALTRVAQTLPASLDLDDVLNSTVGRIRSMIEYEALVVFVFNNADQTFEPIRVYGAVSGAAVNATELSQGLTLALAAPKTVRVESVRPGDGVDQASRSGLYVALRARGALVGLIAIEAHRPHAFSAQHAEVLHGLAEPFGIAIDNARLFRQIRTMAADEERARIARDLHDRVGSSLALIGFEVDQAQSAATAGQPVEDLLGELRNHVRSVVIDVRDTLYDLRAEITDEQSLAAVTEDFLIRFEQRTGIDTTFDTHVEGRISVPHERELWHILRESMVNIERHSRATEVSVEFRETADYALMRITDNGVGYGNAPSRGDSYGVIGMRERATNIGASFSVKALPTGGTEVRVNLSADEGSWRGFSPAR